MESSEDVQGREWQSLYERLIHLLAQFGVEDHFGDGDYLVVDDNYGWTRHSVEIHKLDMLEPAIVNALREQLHEFPHWEIVVAVDIPGTEKTWPRMGVTIRRHEIIDGLQRDYLPPAFRSLAYPDSRPGSGYD